MTDRWTAGRVAPVRLAGAPRSVIILAIALGLALGALAIPGAAATRAASADWAWLIVRQAGDHTPAPRDRANSTGAVDSVVDLSALYGPGAYGITLNDVAPAAGEQGSVLVSTLGTEPRICGAQDWSTTNDDVSIVVRCFSRTGAPTSASFIVNWLAASGTGGLLAYATDLSPAGKCGPAPRQYHSQGAQIISCEEGGLGRLTTGSLGSGGHAQSSALSRRSDTGDTASAGLCAIAAFEPQAVSTVCFGADGSPQIQRSYSMWRMKGLGLKGVVRTRVAYLYANRPTRTAYQPLADYRYSSSGKVPRIERLGKGRYRVTLPGQPAGGSAQVTPYASKDGASTWLPRHCVIASIASSQPQRIGVRCFDSSGSLADSRFMLAYAK